MSKGKRKSKQDKRGMRAGADEALSTLINQFADPLSFLRELIQNSLDADSTLIEVRFFHEAPKNESDGDGYGVVEVTDNGSGMNEAIIDGHLLTLFSSSKEDDLTKIGRFGIGFVSIFAIGPELAVLETGRAGESWRLVFYPDGRFEKMRLDHPVEGTQLRLYKKMSPEDLEQLRKDGARTVRYWCKFAGAELLVDGTPIQSEFGLDSSLKVYHQEPGTEYWVGLSKPTDRPDFSDPHGLVTPTIGFYNRGLTLIESEQFEGLPLDLTGLSIVAKSRYLEHTLTRDNVRQDENFHKLIKRIRKTVEESLRPRFFEHLEKLAKGEKSEGPSRSECLIHMALPALAPPSHAPDRPLFKACHGEPLSYRVIQRREKRNGRVLLAGRPDAITELLGKRNIPVLDNCKHLQAFLANRCGLTTAWSKVAFATALKKDVPEGAQKILAEAQRILSKSGAKVSRLHLGQIVGSKPVAKKLTLRQSKAFGLTELGKDDQPKLLGGAWQLVLNFDSPIVRDTFALGLTDPVTAGFLLAAAVVEEEQRVRGGMATVARYAVDRLEDTL